MSARRARAGLFELLAPIALCVVVVFLALPVLAIFLDVGPGRLIASLGDPVAIDALVLSLEASLTSLALIVLAGTPAAYLLATRDFAGRALVVTLLELPLVLPPAVAGIGLLAALGPAGLLGPLLARAGIDLSLSQAAVVLAMIFVASPFYLRQAQASFAAIDPSLPEASRTLGASEAGTFARVAIPIALPGLGAGAALAWGRALGEFGATIMFAGSFQGLTQTLPLAIYQTFSSDFTAALAMSGLLVAVSGGLLGGLKLLGRREREQSPRRGSSGGPDGAPALPAGILPARASG